MKQAHIGVALIGEDAYKLSKAPGKKLALALPAGAAPGSMPGAPLTGTFMERLEQAKAQAAVHVAARKVMQEAHAKKQQLSTLRNQKCM
jgi:hypothetical protein